VSKPVAMRGRSIGRALPVPRPADHGRIAV
jgi:hypothetical protein